MFPEVRQTWLGFTESGNKGSGLGNHFASALHENLHRLFGNFRHERITKGSHLEKLCLIKERVGKDLFRLADAPAYILATDRFVEVVKKLNLTGVVFEPVNVDPS